jgi:hypothetical protein
MNVRQISFLIFHDSHTIETLVKNLAFDHIIKKSNDLHSKNSRYDVRTIRCDLSRKFCQLLLNFESMRIDRKNDEEREFVVMSNDCHAVLKKTLHISSVTRITKRKNESTI